MDSDEKKGNSVSQPGMIRWFSPTVAFALVAFTVGELGDGLNIFQGIYLVGTGWKEGAVGTALSLMGFTALVVQTFAGDVIDKTFMDRRAILAIATIVTAISASMIFFVREGNQDHGLMYISKVVEGVSVCFIAPCLAALTLATFGPHHFDAVMASNMLWGHVGGVVAAVVAGLVAYLMYPDIKLCFLVIGASALGVIFFIQYLPEGDPLMGRGFQGKKAIDELGHEEMLIPQSASGSDNPKDTQEVTTDGISFSEDPPKASSYWEVISDRRSFLVCITGFFFHFANANVLLVLGELMGGNQDDGSPSRAAIPLTAGAIVLARITMAAATWAGDKLTHKGIGRKPLFLAGLATLPIRCALIIYWKDSGPAYLLSTQILDGLGGGFVGLIHPYLVADITFGTGRFNLLMGLTPSMFGLGGTMSNFLGQHVAESFGYVASLMGSLFLSFIPVGIFAILMPETLGDRMAQIEKKNSLEHLKYAEMT